jgi:hypothetical protein
MHFTFRMAFMLPVPGRSVRETGAGVLHASLQLHELVFLLMVTIWPPFKPGVGSRLSGINRIVAPTQKTIALKLLLLRRQDRPA